MFVVSRCLLSVVCCVLFVVSLLLFVVCCLLFVVSCCTGGGLYCLLFLLGVGACCFRLLFLRLVVVVVV